MTLFKHIIWDFDGCLFNTYPAFGRAFVKAMAEFGIEVEASRAEQLARQSLSHCAITLANENNLEREMVSKAFMQHYASVAPEEQAPYLGAVALCEAVVAQNGLNFIVTHRGQRSTWHLLDAYQMGPLFAEVITGDDAFPRKPDGSAFRHILQRYQLAPQDVLAIGDRDLDILAGQAVGVVTCRFDMDICPVGADLTVVDLRNLISHLRNDA